MASLLRPGDVCGEHRIVRLLGAGGFAEVYEAIDPAGAPRALKILTSRAPAGSKLRARLEREADALARVQHPNVVRLFAAGLDRDCVYFILELVDGTTLAEQILAHRGLPPIENVLAWLIQACEGVAEAHRAGVVHRDLKPTNILITPTDDVKVIDFGIAKLSFLGATTTSGGLMGTAPYMASEQLHGGHVDARADVYAMGVILYQTLAGAHPLGLHGDSLSVIELLQAHLLAEPRPLDEVAPEVSPELAALVHRAMAKNPDRRVSSMRELADGLRAALDDLLSIPPDLRRQLSLLSTPTLPPDARSPLADTARVDMPRDALPPPAPCANVTVSPMRVMPEPSTLSIERSPSSPPPRHGSSLPVVSEPRRVVPKPRRAWLAVVAVAALASAMGLVAQWSTNTTRHAETPSPTSTIAPPAPIARADWIGAHDRAVIEADVDGDPAPDILGYCGDGAAASVCAYSGATLQPRWRAPATDRRQFGPIGVAGRTVAYADARAIVHVLDLATGAERGEVPIGGRAKRACTAPEAQSKVWFELEDGRGALLDPVALRATAASMPDGCKLPPPEGSTELVDGGPRRQVVLYAPKVPGFVSRVARIDGANGVALGAETLNGTVPMLLGFTPGQHSAAAVRWKRPLLPGDGLGGHGAGAPLEMRGARAVTVYEDLAGAPHLVAIDAVSGKTLWDVDARAPLTMTVSTTRVYAQRNGRLDVRDAATGALLGSLGEP